LIIDEALSVGDIQFQQRCLDRIRSFQREGTSLLFVSHDLGTVAAFCRRVIVLEDGRAVYDGEPKAGLERYYASMIRSLSGTEVAAAAPPGGAAPAGAPGPADVAGDDALPENPGDIVTASCTLRSVRFFDRAGRRIFTVSHGEPVDLAAAVQFHEAVEDPHLGFKLHNKDGLVMFETVTYCLRHMVGRVQAGETVVFHFRFEATVQPGEYTVTIGVSDGGYNLSEYRRQLAYRSHCVPLNVARDESFPWSGLVNLRPSASSERR
jgi:lipopolysaccharide transport system ATP-binding protein